VNNLERFEARYISLLLSFAFCHPFSSSNPATMRIKQR